MYKRERKRFWALAAEAKELKEQVNDLIDENQIKDIQDEVEELERSQSRYNDEQGFLEEIKELLNENFPWVGYLSERPDKPKEFLDKCNELYKEYINL